MASHLILADSDSVLLYGKKEGKATSLRKERKKDNFSTERKTVKVVGDKISTLLYTLLFDPSSNFFNHFSFHPNFAPRRRKREKREREKERRKEKKKKRGNREEEELLKLIISTCFVSKVS